MQLLDLIGYTVGFLFFFFLLLRIIPPKLFNNERFDHFRETLLPKLLPAGFLSFMFFIVVYLVKMEL